MTESVRVINGVAYKAVPEREIKNVVKGVVQILDTNYALN